jgi:hypothetical protein
VAGDHIRVMVSIDGGWWQGKVNGKIGQLSKEY